MTVVPLKGVCGSGVQIMLPAQSQERLNAEGRVLQKSEMVLFQPSLFTLLRGTTL